MYNSCEIGFKTLRKQNQMKQFPGLAIELDIAIRLGCGHFKCLLFVQLVLFL